MQQGVLMTKTTQDAKIGAKTRRRKAPSTRIRRPALQAMARITANTRRNVRSTRYHDDSDRTEGSIIYMYTDFYERISAPFRRSERAIAALSTMNKLLVWATAAAFLGLAAWLAFQHDTRIIRFLTVCAISFAGATALRSALNLPRPYELYPIDGLIRKGTKGKSFPSRHLFSASVISCALLWVNIPAGIICFAATAILAAIRVVGGVHFPRDVIAGIALGLACGFVGFWVI